MERQTEMEIVAKNTIVEIYLIEKQIKDMEIVLNNKKEYLVSINSSLQENLHSQKVSESYPEEKE